MANTLGLDYAEDQAEVATDNPSTLVWSGQTITGAKGSQNEVRDVDESGIAVLKNYLFICSTADFTSSTLPAKGATVTVDSEQVYVQDAEKNEDGTVVTFLLQRTDT